MDRKEFIGGSDIAAIMGLSRWKTPLQLWAEKTGEIEAGENESEAAELGRELEDFVAKKFMKKTGLSVRRAPKIYVHFQHGFLRCQVDRLITGNDDELLEVKTASAWKLKEWEGDEIPQEYICQVIWQLGITGRTKGWIAVLIGGQKFIFKEISFDRELFDQMVEQALVFWKMVKEKTPPMATCDDKETLLALYPTELNDEMLQNYQDMENQIAHRQELKMHIDEMIEEKEAIENRLRQIIGENAGIITEKYTVKNKKQKTVPKILFDKMHADGIYEKYTEENFTRVLRISLNKKEKTNGEPSTNKG